MKLAENTVLIGAGSAVFTRGLVTDMIDRGWEGEIRLVDVDPEALAVAVGLSEKMIRRAGARIGVKGSTDRRELLPGATLVICTVGVGGRRAWERDVFIPRRYGIYQPVGDTVMPGGTSRALRMVPAMVAIARDVGDLAPEALFFNYGNPMSPVCRGIRKATGVPVVGLCHGVNHVVDYIARSLGVAPTDLEYTAAGINHLTWFTEVSVQGRDLMPALRAAAKERVSALSASAAGPDTSPVGAFSHSVAGIDNPFTWELVDITGAFPAVLDRHVTEFFPHLFSREGSYYGRTLGVNAFSFEGTIESGDRTFAEMKALAAGSSPLPADFMERTSGEHEQVTDIVESIRTDARRTYSANIPNEGQVGGLPPEAVVECPCVAGAGGIEPAANVVLPPVLAGTLSDRFHWVDTVVDAALDGDPDEVIQALLIDGSARDPDTCRKLAMELIRAHSRYLPAFGGI